MYDPTKKYIRCEKCGNNELDTEVITPRVCFKCGSPLGLRGHPGEMWYDQVYVERIDENVEGYCRVFMRPYSLFQQCIGVIVWDTHVDRKNCPYVGDCISIEMRVKSHGYRTTHVSHVKIDKENPPVTKYREDLDYHDMWSP